MSKKNAGDHVIKGPRLPMAVVVHGDDNPTKRKEKTPEEKEKQKKLWPGQDRPRAPGEHRVWG